jgi:hypothetical protein
MNFSKEVPRISRKDTSLSDKLTDPPVRRYLGGLLIRRECWTLSLKARLIGLLACILTFIVVVERIHGFLSITQRTSGEFLIVEGWIPTYAMREAKEVFERGGYQRILTCGTPVIDDSGGESHVTYADWGASKLVKFGASPDQIQPIPAPMPLKDRTYTSAVAVKAWLDAKNLHPKSIDLITLGTHGRRSRMLFKKAFGPDIKVGVISLPNATYDKDHWWRSSAGVREVLDEAIAYLYAFVFVRFSSGPS